MSFAGLLFSPTQILELLATVIGLVSVALLARGDGRGWPVGAIWAALSIWLYLLSGIYGQAALSLYFLAAQFVGWRRWWKGEERDLREVSRTLSLQGRVRLGLGWLAGTALLALALDLGASRFPALDAFATVGSLIGQALMVVGVAEAWPVYLLADLVLVALSLRADMWFYAAMYVIYCGLAWQGWRGWTRDQSGERETAHLET